jgi:hypothetical protein
MTDTAQSPIAEVLAQAKLALDTAIQRAHAGEPFGSISSPTLQKLAAAGTSNTSCNTGCTIHPK